MLGHDNALATERWKQESPDVELPKHNKSRLCFSVLIVTGLLIPLATLFILYLQWYSFQATGSNRPNPPDLATPTAEPVRDLKSLLHPEDHVLRDPKSRHIWWNITKGTIVPNGVRKHVFLINGTANNLCILYTKSGSLTGNNRSISWPHS